MALSAYLIYRLEILNQIDLEAIKSLFKGKEEILEEDDSILGKLEEKLNKMENDGDELKKKFTKNRKRIFKLWNKFKFFGATGLAWGKKLGKVGTRFIKKPTEIEEDKKILEEITKKQRNDSEEFELELDDLISISEDFNKN